MQSMSSDGWRRARALAMILLVAAVCRAGFVGLAWQHPERALYPDSQTYIQPGLNWLAGHGFSSERTPPHFPTARRTPVYPVFVGAILSLAGGQLQAVMVVQALLGTCTTALVYLLTRQLSNHRAACWSALLFALSLGPMVYVALVLSETLFSFLLVGGLLTLVYYHRSGRCLWLGSSGLLFALAVLCRPIALTLSVLALPIVWLRNGRNWRLSMAHTLVYCAGVGVLTAPWMVRNYHHFGQPLLSTISAELVYLYSAVAVESARTGESQVVVRQRFEQQIAAELQRRGYETNERLRFQLCDTWGKRIVGRDLPTYAWLHMRHSLNSLLPNFSEPLQLLGATRGGTGALSVLNTEGPRAAARLYFGDKLWVVGWLAPAIMLLGLQYSACLWGLALGLRQRDWLCLFLTVLPASLLLLTPGIPSCPRFSVPAMPYVCLAAGLGLERLFSRWAQGFQLRRRSDRRSAWAVSRGTGGLRPRAVLPHAAEAR